MNTDTLPPRSVTQVVPMPWHAFDTQSGAAMLRAPGMSPFLGIDSFAMPQPVFGPHPHAGMSAVTLMLAHSPGGVINRDSLGDHSRIGPGDLHWTQAGRGMIHEEVPSEAGRAALGLQVFVNLARHHKQADPVALRVAATAVPEQRMPGALVRVVAGTLHTPTGPLRSPIAADPRWLTQVNLFEISLDAGAQVALTVPADHNAFFVARSGTMPGVNQRAAEAAQGFAVFYATGGDAIEIRAGEGGLHGVLCTGQPIDEPVYPGGPFTGNSRADILNYQRAYQSGAMGQLSPSHPAR